MIRGGFARWPEWWNSKMPPHFAVTWALLLVGGLSADEALPLAAAALLVSGIGIGAWGHLVNDLSDVQQDRDAGRRNSLAHLSPGARFAATLSCAALAFLPAIVVDYGREAILWLSACALVPAAYSLRPLRLKERGVLGVAADSAGAYVLPILFLGALLAPSDSDLTARYASVVASAVAWGATAGVRGILRHQLHDRASDIAVGCRTFVTDHDPAGVIRFLRRVATPTEVLAFAALAWCLRPEAPALIWVYGSYLAYEALKAALGFRQRFHDDQSDEGVQLPLANNLFQESVFPVTLALAIASRGGAFVAVPIAQVLLFPRVLITSAVDVWRTVTSVSSQVAVWSAAIAAGVGRGWRIDVQSGAHARLDRVGSGSVRVSVERVGAQPWSVRAYRVRPGVRRRSLYVARLRARADRPGTVAVGLCQAGRPWGGLGLHRELEVDEQWQSLEVRFRALSSSMRCQEYVWLGNAPIVVELAEMRVERDRGRTPDSIAVSDDA